MRHEELHGYDPSGSVRHGPGRNKYLLWRGYGKYIQPAGQDISELAMRSKSILLF